MRNCVFCNLDENIVKKSRLEPGKMLLVDTTRGEIISDEKCK